MQGKHLRGAERSDTYQQLLIDITKRLCRLRTDYDRYVAGLSPPPPPEAPHQLQRALQQLRRRALSYHAVQVRCDEMHGMLAVLKRHWVEVKPCSPATQITAATLVELRTEPLALPLLAR